MNSKEIQEIFDSTAAVYVIQYLEGEKVVKSQMSKINNVTSKIFEENGKRIGYIRLCMFTLNSYKDFKAQFEKMECDSLIIDLRDNPGGEASNMINIASLFLDRKKAICIDHYRNKTKTIYSKGSKNYEYPIVILANNNSASCSEVLIGALLEGCNAKLIGTKTFGKGVAQAVKESENYYYRYTVCTWTTPSGKSINGVGFKPDIEIENDTNEDMQLQKAIEYLKNY